MNKDMTVRDLSDEELLDKIMYTQQPVVEPLRWSDYYDEVLRRLGQSAARVEEVAREIACAPINHWSQIPPRDTKHREEYDKGLQHSIEQISAILRQHGYDAQGQGVGPRCPKCSGQLGFTHNRILTFLSCYKCKETFELHRAEDMAQFFSPVPSLESATPLHGICPNCGADRSGPSAEAHAANCPENIEEKR